MGHVQKEAFLSTLISYLGLGLGYINKGVLFIIFLSPEEIGLVNLLYSVGMLFGQFANIGIVNTVWRFFPYLRNKSKNNYHFLERTLKLILLSTLAFIVLIFFLKTEIIFWFKDKSALFVDYYYWIIPIGVGNVFYIIMDIYLRGLSKNWFSIFMYEFVNRVIILLFIVMYIFKWIDFNSFVILVSLSYLVPTLALLVYLIRLGELKPKSLKFDIPKKFKQILVNYSLFSYVNSIGITLVVTMDAMMIASYLGLKETGIYTTILFLISAMQIPNKSIFRVSSNLVSEYWKKKDLTKMNELYRKTSSVSLVISLYVFLLVWLNIDDLFSFLKPEYRIGILPFLVFMMGKLIDIYFGLNGFIFITSKKYKLDIYFTLSMILVVYLLNIYLIPIYGITGAAFSTSVAIIFYNFMRLFFLWKWFKLHPFEKEQFYVIVIFILIWTGFEFLPDIFANKFLRILVKSGLISITFLGSIWFLNLNEDIKNYILKFKRRLLKQ